MKLAVATSLIYMFGSLRRFYFSSLMEHAQHFSYKWKSYSLIFPAAQLCPSELINEICHHAKPLCLTTFPKTPQLPAPWCSPTSSHILTHSHTNTSLSKCLHTCIHTHTQSWTVGLPNGQAGKQPDKHSHVYALERAFFHLFFSQQAYQTNGAKSLFVFMRRLLCQCMF